MPITNLNNITIKKLEDRNFKPYYVIVNNDNSEEVYYAFEWTVKEGWQDLVSNYENIKEVEIEYIEHERDFKVYKKVVSLYAEQGEIIV